jgi:hypothetical protein
MIKGLAALAGALLATAALTPATAGEHITRFAAAGLTAAPLPTWQTNGTVWAMEQLGGVIYVGGNFTAVRPPGAGRGVREVARKNLAAFDARTGALLPFSHRFSAASMSFDEDAGVPDVSCSINWSNDTYSCDTVYEIRKVPNGAGIFVSGDFTAVDGAPRQRLAAFYTANARTANATLRPGFGVRGPDYRAHALAATDSTLYIGGLFRNASGQPRDRLAAYRVGDGALLPWAPKADDSVLALAFAPDRSRLVVGGNFRKLNGVAIHALAAVHAGTGALTRWDSRPIPGTAQITDLVVDRDTVYAASDGSTVDSLDGRVAADPYTGAVRWSDGCLGSTWALTLIGDTLYSGSHAHNCASIGAFPEQRGDRYFRLLGETTRDRRPTLRHWFPTTNGGDPSVDIEETPARLGPRAMTTDGVHLWVGGQFTTVNGRPQEGLTRFGPRPNRSATPTSPDALTARSARASQATVSWRGAEDLDDRRLAGPHGHRRQHALAAPDAHRHRDRAGGRCELFVRGHRDRPGRERQPAVGDGDGPGRALTSAPHPHRSGRHFRGYGRENVAQFARRSARDNVAGQLLLFCANRTLASGVRLRPP